MTTTGFKKDQILYSVKDVSAEMYGKLPTRGYRVVDPRTGWALDAEENPYRATYDPSAHYMILLREVSRGESDWIDGELAVVREGDTDGVISEKNFRERCERWANPVGGTHEHFVVQKGKILALCKELGVKTGENAFGEFKVDDGEILRLLEQYKVLRDHLRDSPAVWIRDRVDVHGCDDPESISAEVMEFIANAVGRLEVNGGRVQVYAGISPYDAEINGKITWVFALSQAVLDQELKYSAESI